MPASSRLGNSKPPVWDGGALQSVRAVDLARRPLWTSQAPQAEQGDEGTQPLPLHQFQAIYFSGCRCRAGRQDCNEVRACDSRYSQHTTELMSFPTRPAGEINHSWPRGELKCKVVTCSTHPIQRPSQQDVRGPAIATSLPTDGQGGKGLFKTPSEARRPYSVLNKQWEWPLHQSC